MCRHIAIYARNIKECAKIEYIITNCAKQENSKFDIDVFLDSSELCNKINEKYDLLIYVCDDSEKDNYSIVYKLQSNPTPVICVVDNYIQVNIIGAVKPMYYINKPIQEKRLGILIHEILSYSEPGVFVYKKGGYMCKIYLKDILYLEGENRVSASKDDVVYRFVFLC